MKNSRIDTRAAVIEVNEGTINLDSTSAISSDGHYWFGKGVKRGFGGSFGGVGGNWDPSKAHEDHTYGSHDLEFKEEYLKVKIN